MGHPRLSLRFFVAKRGRRIPWRGAPGVVGVGAEREAQRATVADGAEIDPVARYLAAVQLHVLDVGSAFRVGRGLDGEGLARVRSVQMDDNPGEFRADQFIGQAGRID